MALINNKPPSITQRPLITTKWKTFAEMIVPSPQGGPTCEQLGELLAAAQQWFRSLQNDSANFQTDLAKQMDQYGIASANADKDKAAIKVDEAKVTQAQHEVDVANELAHSPSASDPNNLANYLREAQAAAQRLAQANLNLAGDTNNLQVDTQRAATFFAAIVADNDAIEEINTDLAIATQLQQDATKAIAQKCKSVQAFQSAVDTSNGSLTLVSYTPSASGTSGSSGSGTEQPPTLDNAGGNQNPPQTIAVPTGTTAVTFLDGGVVSTDQGTPNNTVNGFASFSTITIPSAPDAVNPFTPPPTSITFTGGPFSSGVSNIFGLPITAGGQVLPTNFTTFTGPVQPTAFFDPATALFVTSGGSPFTTFSADTAFGDTNVGTSPSLFTGGFSDTGNTGSLGDINISTSLGDGLDTSGSSE